MTQFMLLGNLKWTSRAYQTIEFEMIYLQKSETIYSFIYIYIHDKYLLPLRTIKSTICL